MGDISVDIPPLPCSPSCSPAGHWTVEDLVGWLRAYALHEHVPQICLNHRLEGSGLVDGDSSRLERLLCELRSSGYPTLQALERCGYLSPSTHNPLPLSPLPPAHPREAFKAAVSVGLFFVSGFFVALSIAIADERAAKAMQENPLRDIVFDHVNIVPAAFAATEKIGMLLGTTLILIFILHKHRFILLRRCLCLMAVVMLLRSLSVIATTLPAPNKLLAQRCLKQRHQDSHEFNWLTIIHKTLEIFIGLGLQMRDVTTCSDLIFSGHTSSIILFCLFIIYYSPDNFTWFHRFIWLVSLVGISCIVIAHEHYSVDVLIALYLAPTLFLYYHSLANSDPSGHSNSSRTRFWFPFFNYFEGNCHGVIPNRYEVPDCSAIFWWKDSSNLVSPRGGSQQS